MRFNSSATIHWQTLGVNDLRWWNAPEFYEGTNTVQDIATVVGFGSVRDIGCGYGRLAKLFKVENYVGYDIGLGAISQANRLNSPYKFVHWDFSTLPFADTTLFVNGPHLVAESEINDLVSLLCENTTAIVFAEIMGTENAKKIQYNGELNYRNIETYDSMLMQHNFKRLTTVYGMHELHKLPYTIARWEHE